MKIAVIGAGISGSAFALWAVEARRCLGKCIEVVIFDKGRRPGGRTSSQPAPGDVSWEADFGSKIDLCA